MRHKRWIATLLLACFIAGGVGGPVAHWTIDLHVPGVHDTSSAALVHSDSCGGPLVSRLDHGKRQVLDCCICDCLTTGFTELSEVQIGPSLLAANALLKAQKAVFTSSRPGLIRGPPLG